MRVLCAVAVLAACNQVYGLDETTAGVPVFDSDGDGILDEDDNCVRVANPDQADVDANGQGDACSLVCTSGTRTNADRDRDRIDDGCDPCPRSPQSDALGPIDEDADGIVDACDNCPGTANADQSNVDGDDLGDACDDARGRVLFDSFRRKQTYWGGASWKFENGHVTSTTGELRLLGIELVSDAQAQRWAVDVGIELPAAATSGSIGAFVRDGAAKRGCALVRNNNGWEVVAAGSTTTITPAPAAAGSVRLRVQLLPMIGPLLPRISCQVAGVTAVANTDALSVSVSLAADMPVRFTYVDLSN